MPAPSALQVSPSRRWSGVAWLVPVAALVAVLAWYATHPERLPATGSRVEATTPDGVPLYVGMVRVPERTLTLRSVEVAAEGGQVRPVICRAGSLGVTTEAEAFCSEVEDAAGATLGPGDQLALEITGSAGSTVTTGVLQVDYREGVQFGDGSAGRPVSVEILD